MAPAITAAAFRIHGGNELTWNVNGVVPDMKPTTVRPANSAITPCEKLKMPDAL